MPKYIALDFDGVICNSINECMLVSYYSYNNISISSSAHLNKIPKSHQEKFIKYRYLVGPAYEYYCLWNSINLTNTINDNLEAIYYNEASNLYKNHFMQST